jgi:hypothetical protein
MSLRRAALVCWPTLVWACATEPPSTDDCADGTCDLAGDDTPLTTACDDVLVDRSGRGFLPERLSNDPVIQFVYQDAKLGCPVTHDGIVAALIKTDTKGCVQGIATGNLFTHVVSEQAQLAGDSRGASYRTVTSRKCGQRKRFGLMFSSSGFADVPELAQAGLDPAGKAIPGGIEIMAFDQTNGVFNYYKEVDGKLGFFGSSSDFVTEGPGGPDITDERGCANCHTGGGPIMKELDAPWLHWQGTFKTPGAPLLVQSRAAVMGLFTPGPELETLVVKPGNRAWNPRRVALMRERGTVAELLRPLFCPVEINIGGTNSKARIDGGLVLDVGLTRSHSLLPEFQVNEQHHDAIAAAIGQNVPGTDARDVVAPMSILERADADLDYVFELTRAGVIDDDFMRDEVTEAAAPGDLRRVHPAARLSPIDCALVTSFVAVP